MPIGGFPSGHVVVLAQASAGVGATTLCEMLVDRVVDNDMIAWWIDPCAIHHATRASVTTENVAYAHDVCKLVKIAAAAGDLIVVDSTLGLCDGSPSRALS